MYRGEHFFGQWQVKGTQQSGRGIILSKDGWIYIGGLKDLEFHGIGKYVFISRNNAVEVGENYYSSAQKILTEYGQLVDKLTYLVEEKSVKNGPPPILLTDDDIRSKLNLNLILR